MDEIGIFIFRRDHRITDNYGLIQLSKQCKKVLPVFILDPHQVKKSYANKWYFNSRAVQFMCESLIDLDHQLGNKLHIEYGEPSKVVHKLIKKYNYDCVVGFNEDFSAYSIKRDSAIKSVCKKHDVPVLTSKDDYTLVTFDQLQGYKQFGAFYKKYSKIKVAKPMSIRPHFVKTTGGVPISKLKTFYKHSENLEIGGRAKALSILANLKKWSRYNTNRDLLTYRTTEISAFLNFGCVSVREFYHAIRNKLGKSNQLTKQLYWRDFFLSAVALLPGGNKFKHMDQRFERIKWRNSRRYWNLLMESKTGFLLIDAAMEQIRQTGYMHNRARLLVGSFWCKYLLINPFHKKYGSQVGFSSLLVDAIGPSQNKMNNHWLTEFDYSGKKFAPKGHPLAGRPMNSGNDTIKKWDPECGYIKKWLPHLAKVPIKDIVKWDKDIANQYRKEGIDHPAPIFDQKLKYKEWLRAVK